MNRLVRTSWKYKYPIVLTSKYRIQILYGKMKGEIKKILRQWCERKAVEMISAQCSPDYIHILIGILPKYSVSEIVGYLKGKSSLILIDMQI